VDPVETEGKGNVLGVVGAGNVKKVDIGNGKSIGGNAGSSGLPMFLPPPSAPSTPTFLPRAVAGVGSFLARSAHLAARWQWLGWAVLHRAQGTRARKTTRAVRSWTYYYTS
jgi:hypothetical protein